MYFEIIGELESIEPIAIGTSIRDIARLRNATALVVDEN